MLNELKKVLKIQREKAENIIENKEKYQQKVQDLHIKDIVNKPLNRLRIEFSSNFLTADCKNRITEEYVRKLHAGIENTFATDENKKEIFAIHQENFEHFLKTGDIKTPLNLKDEEMQLFWGAALALYALHPEMAQKWNNGNHNTNITKSTIWRRIASSTYMRQELQKHAAILDNSLSNPNAKIVWSAQGYPNIGYCFIPEENLIIDDMLWTLVTGTDTATPAINHEIAHSQGTQFTKSPRMEEIDKRHKELTDIMRKASQNQDRETYNKAAKEAVRLKLEFQYRFYFLDELENMYANRFAVNFGGEYDAAHLNELETDINVGAKYLAPKSIEEAKKIFKQSPEQRIMHIKAIARNSFFANNKLIAPLKFEEWHSLHLYPELLNGVDADGHQMNALECFECIREICNKFETAQPSLRLKNLNEKMYQSRMTSMSKRRAAMVDEFFDMFVAPKMEELYENAEKQFNEQNKQMQNQQQGQGESQEQQPEKQQSQENEYDKQSGSSSMSEVFPPMEQFELPNTESQYRPKLSEEELKSLLEKAENLQDLKNLFEQRKKDDNKEAKALKEPRIQNDPDSTEDNLEDYIPQNDYPILIDIDAMKKLKDNEMQAAGFYREGNWDEYQKYIAQYTNEIAQAKKLIAGIIKQNKLDSIRRGHEKTKEKMTKLPVQGGQTIDLQRHIALEQKIRSNNPNITHKDLARFRTRYKYSEDEVIKEIQIPQSNFGILIDGSGSMTGRPFENALAISCILYEAARSFKEINIYIYMMGEPTPLTIALPEDTTKEIAQRLESVRKGQGGCKDFLTPAVRQLLIDVSDNMQKHPHVKSGFTHIFSVTDGGNNDYANIDVNSCIEKLLAKNEQITFDSFFIDGGWRNYTKPLIDKLKKQGSTQIDCVDDIDSPEKIPAAIAEMLKKRMKNSQIKSPQTNAVKQKLITDTLKNIRWR